MISSHQKTLTDKELALISGGKRTTRLMHGKVFGKVSGKAFVILTVFRKYA